VRHSKLPDRGFCWTVSDGGEVSKKISDIRVSGAGYVSTESFVKT